MKSDRRAVLTSRDNFATPEGLGAHIAKHPRVLGVRPDIKIVFFGE